MHTKRLHSNSHFNQYLSALYKVVGTFLFGAAVSQSLTDLAKFTIGRPRPNFLAVCAPVTCSGYMLQINCTGNPRNVTESRCSKLPLGKYLNPTLPPFFFLTSLTRIDGGFLVLCSTCRLSFYSGHSSFGMYSMLFLSVSESLPLLLLLLGHSDFEMFCCNSELGAFVKRHCCSATRSAHNRTMAGRGRRRIDNDASGRSGDLCLKLHQKGFNKKH